MTNIALLIPSTTKGKNWKKIEDSFFYKIFIPSFIKIINDKFTYKIFLGYDQDDTLLRKLENHEICKDILKNDNVQIEFIKLNVPKGYLSKMWNILFKKAYDDNYDYFYQCGDDIEFNNSKQIFDLSIEKLKNKNNIGVSGPYTINGNRKILTQSFVSRKHMDIFGFYFPEEIKNWYVDDWMSEIYKPDYFSPISNNKIKNSGGNVRYVVKKDYNWKKFVILYKKNLNTYLNTNK
jgi:hypothetical protein